LKAEENEGEGTRRRKVQWRGEEPKMGEREAEMIAKTANNKQPHLGEKNVLNIYVLFTLSSIFSR
jgi:hypothetical protein